MRRGWNQSELASRIEKTQTAVSYWESGKRTPGIDDLIELAGVLEVRISDLLPSSSRPTAPALLRATAERLADVDLQRAIDNLVDQAEGSEQLPAELSVTARGPSNAANELIEKAGIEIAPVPVEQLAIRCGVMVIYRPFPDSLSGLVFALDEGAVIGINEDHHRNRQRFSLAHELGHFLLEHHQAGDDGDGLHIDTAEGTTPGFDWQAEREANDFAAELLMPRKLLSRAFESAREPEQLAAQFEVSKLAMGYRLVNLGLR